MLQSLKQVTRQGMALSLVMAVALPGHESVSQPVERHAAKATMVLAGGCFWGVEAVYRHVKGVKSVVSGFAVPEAPAGEASMANSKPGYAEAVRIEYDPAAVSYDQLMAIFFTVAHDPTQLGRQGPDVGPEYRSVIFAVSDAERGQAEEVLSRYKADSSFKKPITTEISMLKSFKVAEAAHQDYVNKNPRSPYVVQNDLPKLQHLQREFPDLYKK